MTGEQQGPPGSLVRHWTPTLALVDTLYDVLTLPLGF